MVVAAVRFQARLTGSESPVGPRTDRVLAGYRRATGSRHRVGCWRAVVSSRRAAAVAANGGDSIHGLRDGAIIAVASDAMLRVSELSALNVGDIATDGSGTATVTVRHSKTDQDADGAVLYWARLRWLVWPRGSRRPA